MINIHSHDQDISVKEVNGELFLFLTFTNNAIDNDYPPDIVSKESQLWFEQQVNSGAFPLPMAFYWHEPMWKFGETVYLFTSETKEKTFSTAAVRVDPGMEKFARAIAKSAGSHRVSHMMRVLDRDPENSIVITRHQTVEVSPLPAGKEANPGTGVVVITKEDDMTKKNIDAGKRAAAAEALDVDEGVLDEVEQMNDARADEIEGRLSKELTPEVKETETEEVVEEVAEEVTPEQVESPKPEQVTFVTAEQMDEIVNVLAENGKALATQISALQKQVELLQKAVDQDTSEEKLSAVKEYIPVAARASWADVLKLSTVAANGSALTKEEVDQLAPEQPAEKEGDGPFAVPILNRLAKGKGL